MSEGDSTPNSRVASLIRIINKAENDTQRFAALLVVSKIKANELTETQRRKLFSSIGFAFPLRLILSNNDAGDCPEKVLKDLGFSILSSYASDSQLILSPEFDKAICPALTAAKQSLETLENQDCPVLTDCVQLLAAAATTENGCKTILRNSGVEQLVDVFCACEIGIVKSAVWNTLQHLIDFDVEIVWSNNREHMTRLLSNVVEEAKHDRSEKKFEMFQQLYSLLSTMPAQSDEFYLNQTWIHHLAQDLYGVLSSKISSKQRDPTLKLCSCLTGVFDLRWTSCNANEKGKKFPILLIQLACVEIDMIVYELAGDAVVELINDDNKMSLLSACFIIIEKGCSVIADFDNEASSFEIFSFQEIDIIQAPLSNAVKVLSENVVEKLLDAGNIGGLLFGCLRVIGSWLNVRFFALSEVGIGISATVLSAFAAGLKVRPSDTVKYISPAVLHYVENPQVRSKMVEMDLISTLCKLVTDEEQNSSHETTNLTAQCLMSLCLEVEDSNSFDGVLPMLMENAVTTKQHDLVSSFYVLTLTLMIWNKTRQHDDRNAERYFRKLISVVHGIHIVNGSKIEVAKCYTETWDEIEQLWSILMKELIRAAQESNLVSEIIMRSRLPTKVDDVLFYAKDTDVELSSTYGLLKSFISTVVPT